MGNKCYVLPALSSPHKLRLLISILTLSLVLRVVTWMWRLSCAPQGGKSSLRSCILGLILQSINTVLSSHRLTMHHAKVVSAAHCQGVASFVTLGMHKIKLSAGEADEFYSLEHIPIAQDAIHPSYNENTNSHDFWAIKLKWASKLYADQVVELDSPADGLELKSGDELVTFGFGTLTSGGATPNILQEVTIDYIPNANCGSYPSNQIDASVSGVRPFVFSSITSVFSHFCV